MNQSSETNDQTWPDLPVIMFLGGVHVCALSALLRGTFSWSPVRSPRSSLVGIGYDLVDDSMSSSFGTCQERSTSP